MPLIWLCVIRHTEMAYQMMEMGGGTGNASEDDLTSTGTNQKMVNRGGGTASTCTAMEPIRRMVRLVQRTGGGWANKLDSTKKIIAWDTAPGKEYFDELFRVSRNQIIWGGNYFELPKTRCFLVWKKTNVPENFSMAMAEYAWTSFNANAKVFEMSAVGMTGRFHPTQKPVELYAWIYKLFAKPGMKILDTHLGSGSSRIAAWDAGLDFVGYEIDKEYFEKEEARFAEHTSQLSLFCGEEANEEIFQTELENRC